MVLMCLCVSNCTVWLSPATIPNRRQTSDVRRPHLDVKMWRWDRSGIESPVSESRPWVPSSKGLLAPGRDVPSDPQAPTAKPGCLLLGRTSLQNPKFLPAKPGPVAGDWDSPEPHPAPPIGSTVLEVSVALSSFYVLKDCTITHSACEGQIRCCYQGARGVIWAYQDRIFGRPCSQSGNPRCSLVTHTGLLQSPVRPGCVERQCVSMCVCASAPPPAPLPPLKKK